MIKAAVLGVIGFIVGMLAFALANGITEYQTARGSPTYWIIAGVERDFTPDELVSSFLIGDTVRGARVGRSYAVRCERASLGAATCGALDCRIDRRVCGGSAVLSHVAGIWRMGTAILGSVCLVWDHVGSGIGGIMQGGGRRPNRSVSWKKMPPVIRINKP